MAIPQVEVQKIIEAMRQFDREVRDTAEWKDWEANKAQIYAIEYEGRRYPPKKIISFAIGAPVSTFVGGPETNEYLNKLGIKVIRLHEMKINEALKLISEKYKTVRETESFKGGNTIRELFDECRRIFQNSAVLKNHQNIRVVSSYGKGNWATIPWISFLDPRETNTTQDGTYVVILFCENGTGCYLKMAQGVTQPSKEFGSKAADVLHKRAEKLRGKYTYLKDKGFDLSGTSDLGSEQRLVKLYEASTVASKYYKVDAFPTEEQIFADLNELLLCYEDYIDSREPNTPPKRDPRDLVLLGTWKDVLSKFEQVNRIIAEKGAWAFWWSFRIRPEAVALLKKPFYLYINVGRGDVPVRLRVEEYRSSSGGEGILSPWPDLTPPEWIGVNKLGEKKSEIFITWAKAISIERLDPPLDVEDFDPAPGLSTKENLLNQMSFGYAYVDQSNGEPLILKGIDKQAHRDFVKAYLRVQKSTLVRYLCALLTKRFTILTGLSGSGKTKLAHAVASWMSRVPDQYRLIAVGADWTSNENVLGFQDALQPTVYRKPASGALDLILCAERDPEHPYFLILDEMNLSHVERYFADILSTIETGQEIALHSADKPMESYPGDPLPVPPKLRLPGNLFIIGTVNIDETTYMFSPKVLDRANVIEFGVSKTEITNFVEDPASVDLSKLEGAGAAYARAFVSEAQSRVISLNELIDSAGTSVKDALKLTIVELFDVLATIGAEFGYRPVYEISRFIYFYARIVSEEWKMDDALDAAIMQKLLPKLHGSKTKLGPVLSEIKKVITENRFPISFAKIERMEQRLKQNGFTSYAEA